MEFNSILEELIEYSKKCINQEIISCQLHIWSCERFLNDLERDWEYYWDEEEAQTIYDWFTYLKHTKGDLAGQPIILTTWQKFVVCQLYGWRVKETGYKRFKTSYTQVARKNAKSQMQAGCLLYDCSVEASKNNEIYETYCAGTKREQSKIILTEAGNMLGRTLLEPKFKINRNEIIHRNSKSFIRALSKEDGHKGDGTNPATLVVDEYHQHRTSEFVDLSLGSNSKDPLCIIITTAGMDLNSPCFEQEYKNAKDILDPNSPVINDRKFLDIHESEEGDDISNENTWKKANPLRAYYKEGLEKIKIAYEEAKNIPDKMISFVTKILNRWLQAKENTYLEYDKWVKCIKDLPSIKNQPCYIGFDVSAKHDLTSISFVIPIMIDNIIKYIIKVHSFVGNNEKLREKELTDKVPYQSWEKRGYITITESPIVDQEKIIKYMEEFIVENKLEVNKLCFDPWNASKLMTDLTFRGYSCVEVYQSHRSLNEATVGLREEVYQENVLTDDNPVMNFAVKNAVTKNSNGMIKIDKEKSTKRIDTLDSTLCAYKLARYHEFALDLSEFMTDDYLDKLYNEE